MDENEGQSHLFATIILRGRGLNPDEATNIFGIMPSKSTKRGDRRNAKERWAHNFWSLTSQEKVNSEDLSEHIEWLLNQFEPVSSQLIEILQREGVEGKLSCFWILPSEHEELTLSPKLISKLAAFGLDLNLDIYGP